MTVIDTELERAIREALAANPQQAEQAIQLMVAGCEQVEEFEEALDHAAHAVSNEEHDYALGTARACFGNMIDIFGELLAIATGVSNTGGA